MTALVVVANQAVCEDILAQLALVSVDSRGIRMVNQVAAAFVELPADIVITEATHADDVAALLLPLLWASPTGSGFIILGQNMAQAEAAALRAGADAAASLPLDAVAFGQAMQTALARGRVRASLARRAYQRGAADERAALLAQVQSESLALMSRLAANIAHEINNPLTPILGLAEMLADEAPPHSIAHVASRTISESARRIAAVVRSLMSFTRPLAHVEEADMRELLAETLRQVKQELDHQRVHVQLHQPDQPLIYAASIAEMRQALFLMIEHARRLMPNGGTLEITLEQVMAKNEPTSIVIAVRDSGTPIAAYHVRHIFEPFYAATGPGIGVGPGLAIARRIIEQHGGAIALEPGIESGNTLRAVLPLR